jgi:hypothetical protein
MPPAVAEMVLLEYGTRFQSELALNRSMERHGSELLRGLRASATAGVVRHGNPEVLEAVLSGKESREMVLLAVASYYDLSVADQRRLVGRGVGQKVATDIVRRAFDRDVQRSVLERVPASVRLEWVTRYGTAEEVWEILTSEVALTDSSVVAALLVHKQLRSRALHCGVAHLVRGACWCEVEPGDQELAVGAAVGLLEFNTVFDPVVGLLNQPGLGLDLRQVLLARMKAEGELVQRGVRTIGVTIKGFSWHGPISSCDDTVELDNLVRIATRRSRGGTNSRMRAVTLPLLYETAHNRHLSHSNLQALSRTLCWRASVFQTPHDPALLQATAAVLQQLSPDDPGKVVRAMTIGTPNSALLEAVGAWVVPLTTRVAEAKAIHERYETRHEVITGTSVAMLGGEHDAMQGRMRGAGEATAAVLGDGSDPSSLRRWQVFLGLVIDDPDVPLSTILSGAIYLVRGEEVKTP